MKILLINEDKITVQLSQKGLTSSSDKYLMKLFTFSYFVARIKGKFAKNQIQFSYMFIILSTFLLLNGCTTYYPMPISSKTVNKSLKSPNMNQIKILAKNFKHPILNNLELNTNDVISPNEAAVIAVLINPSLRVIRDERGIAEAQLLNAGLLPNLELSYSLDFPANKENTKKVNAFGLGLDWSLISLITRKTKVCKANTQKEAVILDIAWQEWQTAQATKSTVYEILSLQNQIHLLEQKLKQIKTYLNKFKPKISKGLATTKEQIIIQTAYSNTNNKLLCLNKEKNRNYLKLFKLMGMLNGKQIHLKNDIPFPSNIIVNKSNLINGLEKRRLDLLAFQKYYAAQESTVREAVLEQFPKINIGPTISKDTDNLKTMGFSLNITLPIFNQNQGRIAISRATRKKLYDEYINRVFEAHSDIENILSGINFLNKQIATLGKTKIKYEKIFENYNLALSEGRINFISYYKIYSELTNIEFKIFDLKGQLAQAVVALELATGYFKIPSLNNYQSQEL